MTATTSPLNDYLWDDDAPRPTSVAPGRWPIAGIVAGIAALASTTVLGPAFITDESIYRAGPEAVYEELGGQLLTQLGAASGYLAAALLIPFGIGLVRTLARRAPDRVGLVLALGVALAAGVASTVSAYAMKSVLASGLPGHGDSGFYTQVDTAVAYTFSGQLQYAGWLPVVGAAGLIGVLVLRDRVMPRWIGVFSAFIAVAVATVTIAFNLPWSAGLVAPLWLIAVAVAVLRLRRRSA